MKDIQERHKMKKKSPVNIMQDSQSMASEIESSGMVNDIESIFQSNKNLEEMSTEIFDTPKTEREFDSQIFTTESQKPLKMQRYKSVLTPSESENSPMIVKKSSSEYDTIQSENIIESMSIVNSDTDKEKFTSRNSSQSLKRQRPGFIIHVIHQHVYHQLFL